jgi:SAM-dependent methyltransferase
MNNYEFCTRWILDQAPGKNIRVLDYGCGAGEIVKALRKQDVNAYGCDVFYEGADYSQSNDMKLFDNGIIKKMQGDTIPFESASFDYLITNQVMEHVENMDHVLSEFDRVLKPGGKILNLFPDKGVWREGHCGIPFIHWFAKNSRFRVYYAAGFRMLGFGYHKGTKNVMLWSRDFCEWLDKWTHYRTRQTINAIYSQHFCDIQHIEDRWLQLRLGDKKSLVTWLPTSIQKLIVTKLGCMIFVTRKPAST